MKEMLVKSRKKAREERLLEASDGCLLFDLNKFIISPCI